MIGGIFGYILIWIIPIINGKMSVSSCYRHHNLTEGEIVNRLMKNYTKALPEIEGPVPVRIEMRIQQISALNELTRDFEIEILFSQLWYDPAFSFHHLTVCKKNITMESALLEDIWTPNTCVMNSKRSTVHASPYDNTMFILYENGSIWVNYRMQVRAPCDLNLRSFPFDTQRCFMRFESYSYNSEQVHLSWLDQYPVTFPDKNAIDLPDFLLVGWSAQNISRPYLNGNWDELKVTFIFKRRYGFFVLQAYVPTYLTIIVSWVSFSMNSEIKALAARSTVGVSCLLALTFQIGNIFENLPPVSYVKAMDVWMLGCITFVFGTIVELALVCSLNKYGRSKSPRLCKQRAPVAPYRCSYMSPNWSPPTVWDREDSPQGEVWASTSRRGASRSPLLQSPSNASSSHHSTVQQNKTSRGWMKFMRGRRCPWWTRAKSSVRTKSKWTCPFHWSHLFTSDQIDRFSMLLFPCGFTVFNIFYWSYYLSQAYAHEKELIETHGIILI